MQSGRLREGETCRVVSIEEEKKDRCPRLEAHCSSALEGGWRVALTRRSVVGWRKEQQLILRACFQILPMLLPLVLLIFLPLPMLLLLVLRLRSKWPAVQISTRHVCYSFCCDHDGDEEIMITTQEKGSRDLGCASTSKGSTR